MVRCKSADAKYVASSTGCYSITSGATTRERSTKVYFCEMTYRNRNETFDNRSDLLGKTVLFENPLKPKNSSLHIFDIYLCSKLWKCHSGNTVRENTDYANPIL